jgi:NhaP-type Na+/H+ or K+/H+ antiporter
MSEYAMLAILAVFVLVYGAVSNRLAKTMVSGAIVYAAFGVLFGPLCLNLLQFSVDAKGLKMLAELTLALVLFTDAANADLSILKSAARLPVRLLLVGLPLTIALGMGAGALLFSGLTLLELGVLATMLAPTDAALGKAVVTNPSVPAKVRESLNVESGLNDGICVPVLFLFLALIAHTGSEGGTAGLAFRLFAEEIGIGGVVGVVLALAAARLFKVCIHREWIAHFWVPVPVGALAFACFATAQALEGSGFIAAFVGGMVFGAVTKGDKEEVLRSAETAGGIFSLLTWVAFGVAVIGHSIDQLNWRILLYAVLSLTVIRMLPVFLSLTGTGLRTNSKLFIGWFGPRGLASVVFIVIVLGEKLPSAPTLQLTVVCTVILSILAHGVTANPLARWYGARAETDGV